MSAPLYYTLSTPPPTPPPKPKHPCSFSHKPLRVTVPVFLQSTCTRHTPNRHIRCWHLPGKSIYPTVCLTAHATRATATICPLNDASFFLCVFFFADFSLACCFLLWTKLFSLYVKCTDSCGQCPYGTARRCAALDLPHIDPLHSALDSSNNQIWGWYASFSFLSFSFSLFFLSSYFLMSHTWSCILDLPVLTCNLLRPEPFKLTSRSAHPIIALSRSHCTKRCWRAQVEWLVMIHNDKGIVHLQPGQHGCSGVGWQHVSQHHFSQWIKERSLARHLGEDVLLRKGWTAGIVKVVRLMIPMFNKIVAATNDDPMTHPYRYQCLGSTP